MLNVAVLMGRLVADPELKHTPNDIAVTRFTIAVGRNFGKTAEERKTDFIDILAWRNTAEFVCKYFRKGQLIAVEGTIQTGSYQDKDGNKRKTFEVLANNVQFAESKRSSEQSIMQDETRPEIKNEDFEAYSSGKDDDFQTIESDEDLPF